MEPLKKLKLTTTKEMKDKHFTQISARLSKDAPPKLAILPNLIVVAMMLIVLLLSVTSPSPVVTTDTGITKIYVNSLNSPSHTKWFVGVKETTDEKHLKMMTDVLDSKKLIESPDQVQDVSFSFTVFYGDGTKKNYAVMSVYNWLWDLDTNTYYEYVESEEWEEDIKLILWDVAYWDRSNWQYIVFIFYFIIKFIVNKWYYPRDVDGHKLPRHSSPIQSVISFLPFLAILIMLYLKHFFHYGVIFIMLTVTVLLLIWVETKFENATWRKWMFLDTYWVFIWTYVFFGV